MAHYRTCRSCTDRLMAYGLCVALSPSVGALSLYRRQGLSAPVLPHHAGCCPLLHANPPEASLSPLTSYLSPLFSGLSWRIARAWRKGSPNTTGCWRDDGQPTRNGAIHERAGSQQDHRTSRSSRKSRDYRHHQGAVGSAASHADRTLGPAAGMARRLRRPQGRPSPFLTPLWSLPLKPDIACSHARLMECCSQVARSSWRRVDRLEHGVEGLLVGSSVRW